MIIQPAQAFESEFFSAIPTPLSQASEYYKKIASLHKPVAEKFPLLKIVQLPKKVPVTAFIQGILLPREVIHELCLLPTQYALYGLPIYADIPENFQNIGIKVYDACKRIIWDNIPYQIKHCMPQNDFEKKYNIWRICTHKHTDIKPDNCVLNVLYSAYHLFLEYIRYEREHVFAIKCHPHGNLRGGKN